MKNLVPGHQYELTNFEAFNDKGQILQFIHKENILKDSSQLTEEQILSPGPDNFELVTISDGTTNEDVIEVLIDRLSFLQAKFPCKENACAITHLQEALMWLEKRTNDRIKRGVEGKNLK